MSIVKRISVCRHGRSLIEHAYHIAGGLFDCGENRFLDGGGDAHQASSMSASDTEPSEHAAAKPMGFWKCWAMSAGVMIGSGVFLLPAVLAPYGSISFLGWLFTSAGAIVIALTLGRLAGRTDESGGFYVYVRDAFGELPGFIVGWSYWAATVFAVAAISVAFRWLSRRPCAGAGRR